MLPHNGLNCDPYAEHGLSRSLSPVFARPRLAHNVPSCLAHRIPHKPAVRQHIAEFQRHNTHTLAYVCHSYIIGTNSYKSP